MGCLPKIRYTEVGYGDKQMNTDENARMVQSWFDSCWPIGKWTPIVFDTKWMPNSWNTTINSRGIEGSITIVVRSLAGHADTIHIDARRKSAESRMTVQCGASATEFERAMQTIIDWVGPSLDDIIDDHFRPAMDLDFLKEEE